MEVIGWLCSAFLSTEQRTWLSAGLGHEQEHKMATLSLALV